MDSELEALDSFVLLVAIKNQYRDVLERLLGDEPAMGSQLEAPVAGVNLSSKLHALAENLASCLITGEEALGTNEFGNPPKPLLVWAVEEGIGTLVEILTAMKGAFITADLLRSPDPARYVIRGGHRQTAMLVLSRQGMCADSSLREHGLTVLQGAAKEGNLDAVGMLIEAGADVNALADYYNGSTALQAAAGGGHYSALEMLLKAGADVNAEPALISGRTALQAAAGGGHHIALDMLLKAGADVNAPPARSGGFTALQAAAGGGHQIALNMLLKAGADVNAPHCEHHGRTALQAAAGGGHQTALDMLLKAGADVNSPSGKYGGRTTLQAAAGGGHHIALNMLLRAGADVNAPPATHFGCTALAAAVEGKHHTAIDMLLQAGADVRKLSRQQLSKLDEHHSLESGLPKVGAHPSLTLAVDLLLNFLSNSLIDGNSNCAIPVIRALSMDTAFGAFSVFWLYM